MQIAVDALTIDSPDPDALAGFYEDLLGWTRTFEDDGEILIAAPDGSGFPLLFLEVDDPKSDKNRLHLDLRPDDQKAAVRRALELGATRVDVGQGQDPDVTWVVMADLDGNEFCILRASDAPADPEALVAAEDAVPFNDLAYDDGAFDDGASADHDDDDDEEWDDADDFESDEEEEED
ncbi:MAG: VOC family protein [Euzebya sp.]